MADPIRACLHCGGAVERWHASTAVTLDHAEFLMTPAEVADYADRAIKRTGRVGFDVGRDIERAKASMHYRNGCFAKYYVTKSHEQYPPQATADRVPVIKWRCGSVVNKEHATRVPTGFKDESEAKQDTPPDA